ncbi:TMV resistance protein N [Morella rubra]|uniref:TMV resistance protein N n=1 Tax=Morella rubra TaxID=262757 RepID=A0A6A1V0D5_9ROSI|nr:TMV resistance protein N [Morella rubra]
MTSLEHLLLDGTAIKELPASLKSLSRLSELTLKYCKNLSVLPSVICGLSSLRVLYVSGCKKLEKFPDLSNMECLQDFQAEGTAIAQLPSPSLFLKNIKRIVVGGYKDFPLDSGDLSFFDVSLSKRSSELINVSHFNFWSPSYISDACCINYCDNERRGCMVYLELERFIGEHEGFEGKSRGHERILGSAVAHGMPDWFTTRSSGSSVTLEMHQNLNLDGGWNSWILESGNLIYQSFSCDIETHEGRLGDFLLLQTPDVASIEPIGFWAFIPVEWFLEQSNNWEGWSYIRASIAVESLDLSTDSSIVEVKECGARLLYEGDALEFSNAVAQGWHRAYYRFLSGHDFEKVGDGVLPLPSLAIKGR